MSDFDTISLFLESSAMGAGDISPSVQTRTDAGMDLAVHKVEGELDAMKLLCAAMLELMIEKEVFSIPELKAKSLEIDARDGVVDGKITRVLTRCPACGKNLMKGKSKCQYCGHGR
jgi:rRNA maturation endonuclease Nob1